MSQYAIPRASVLPIGSEDIGTLPRTETVPEQRCFGWDAPDLSGIPPARFRNRLSLTVDISESASDVAACLERFGVQLLRKPVAADYAVGSVGIKRKSGAELIRSAHDGTLSMELTMFAHVFQHRILVCEGLPDEGAAARRVWGGVLQAALRTGIPPLLTRNGEDTARLITWIGGVVTARRRKRPPVYRASPRISTAAARHLHLLADLPNVGMTLARKLVEQYGRV